MADQVTSSGVVIVEGDGRVYIRKVANNYMGYKWSFAKGQVKPGLTLEENALKELREEMGLEARIVGVPRRLRRAGRDGRASISVRSPAVT